MVATDRTLMSRSENRLVEAAFVPTRLRAQSPRYANSIDLSILDPLSARFSHEQTRGSTVATRLPVRRSDHRTGPLGASTTDDHLSRDRRRLSRAHRAIR